MDMVLMVTRRLQNRKICTPMNRLIRSIPLVAVMLAPLSARAQDAPIPPHLAASKMTLPEGFKSTLFAGEPDVVQPIAFTFDDRGRLWVVECL